MEFPGIDANGGPMYIGTGCFHRRVNLCERKHCNEHKVDWKRVADIQIEGNARDLEEECKVLASCAYEENTQWGIEVSLSLSPSLSLSLVLLFFFCCYCSV